VTAPGARRPTVNERVDSLRMALALALADVMFEPTQTDDLEETTADIRANETKP